VKKSFKQRRKKAVKKNSRQKGKRKREKNRSREKARAFLTTNNKQHRSVFSLLNSFCFDGAFRAAL